jgi:NADH-quinone oxidoreductase subunit N
MIKTDFLCLTPLMIVAAAPVIMMLTIAITRNFKIIYGFSLLAFLIALVSVFFVLPAIPYRISQLLIFDNYSILFISIIISASILVTVLSYGYLQSQESEKEEYFMILFVATLGSLLLVSACSFVTLFLGLETLSISLFILIAYRRVSDRSIEAGVKYLILASVSSAFLLFGMGLIYAGTGLLEFKGIYLGLKLSAVSVPLLSAGFAMMLVGIGFKLAVVPFHMWTPDVYQGAPTPVAAYIATISKGAVMALFIRFFYVLHGNQNESFLYVITVIAVLSMFIGNLLAIRQQNLKRILAFSSIANLGYLLITLVIGNENGIQSAIFYLISYIITTLGAFGVIALLSDRTHDADILSDYRGLFWKRPWIAIVFTLALLSLAGIPITAGFMAKFYLVFSGINSGLWLLVFSLIINSVIGLYYYLRVITTLFVQAETKEFPSISFTGNLFLAFTAIGILWLGIFPEWFFHFIAQFSSMK